MRTKNIRRIKTGRRELVPLHRLVNAPRSFIQAVRRSYFGIYPKMPWIPFAAITALDRLLAPSSSVLEIGSGMSTLWLAKRVAHVTSVEHNPDWFRRLSDIIAKDGITNIDLRLRMTGDQMADLTDVPDQSVDLLFVDGGPRNECLVNGFQKVRPTGAIYLDNYDVPTFWLGSSEFLESVRSGIKERHKFIDYIAGSFCVAESLLIIKKGHE